MAKFAVTVAITGTAWIEVDAENKEDAIEKSAFLDGWEIEEWDRNTEAYRGGHISAEEL